MLPPPPNPPLGFLLGVKVGIGIPIGLLALFSGFFGHGRSSQTALGTGIGSSGRLWELVSAIGSFWVVFGGFQGGFQGVSMWRIPPELIFGVGLAIQI